jgi:RNA polymerase sigma factor (sigma-70 family)
MATASAHSSNLQQIDSIALASLCAEDLTDSDLWAEFLRRFAARIKFFIKGTLRQSSSQAAQLLLQDAQESDLLQSVIIRLMDNDGAALRRFSGTTEGDLLAYLAVVARSVVRDSLRRDSADKRMNPWAGRETLKLTSHDIHRAERQMDRELLAKELEQLSMQMIEDHSGDPVRDRLIFQLYFVDGLSTSQIAECKGIGLSKSAIEKAISLLRNRVRHAAGAADPAVSRG